MAPISLSWFCVFRQFFNYISKGCKFIISPFAFECICFRRVAICSINLVIIFNCLFVFLPSLFANEHSESVKINVGQNFLFHHRENFTVDAIQLCQQLGVKENGNLVKFSSSVPSHRQKMVCKRADEKKSEGNKNVVTACRYDLFSLGIGGILGLIISFLICHFVPVPRSLTSPIGFSRHFPFLFLH